MPFDLLGYEKYFRGRRMYFVPLRGSHSPNKDSVSVYTETESYRAGFSRRTEYVFC